MSRFKQLTYKAAALDTEEVDLLLSSLRIAGKGTITAGLLLALDSERTEGNDMAGKENAGLLEKDISE
jgi:hypothetical protein